jgi:hypothetical protein
MTDIEKIETEIAELRARRDHTIGRAAAILDNESRALDAEIEQAAARVEAAKAAEAAEQERANAVALHDAAQHFSACAAQVTEALARAVNSSDREQVVLMVIRAIEDVRAALAPRQTHGRTYRFLDPEETVVVRNDGARFSWPRDPTNADANPRLHGRMNPGNIPGGSRIVEQWLHDGGPNLVAPYKPPLVDDHDRARRRDADVPRRLR